MWNQEKKKASNYRASPSRARCVKRAKKKGRTAHRATASRACSTLENILADFSLALHLPDIPFACAESGAKTISPLPVKSCLSPPSRAA